MKSTVENQATKRHKKHKNWAKTFCAFCDSLWRSHYSVLCDDLPVEVCTQLRRTLLACVIDIMNSEAVGVTIGPFEVVHQTP